MIEGRVGVFLDRDGTIIEDRDYPGDPGEVRLLPGAAAAIRRLNERHLPVIVVTNQSGIARGLITEGYPQATVTQAVVTPDVLRDPGVPSVIEAVGLTKSYGRRRGIVDVSFEDAAFAPRARGTGRQPTFYNYFIGNDSTKWATDGEGNHRLPTWAQSRACRSDSLSRGACARSCIP